MAERIIQASFNVGELAPALYARTDLTKYHSAAALVRNFFVDYRGGVSTRPGTRYICKTFKNTAVRLLPFQASFAVDYILEFGDGYIRFINNGAPVLEPALAVGAANTFAVSDWVYFSGTGTTLDGNYYIVNVPGNRPRIIDLFGNHIPNTATTGTISRVYTIASPYAAADLRQLKFTQDISTMILCHPNYPPYALTLITSNNWTMSPVVFGTAAQAPQGISATAAGLLHGSVSYSYTVTAVDEAGEESGAGAPAYIGPLQDVRVTNGTIRITWNAVAGAKSYNIYKSDVTYFGAVPPGVPYGYIGTSTGTTFDDSNIAPDFTETPPILQTPFLGGGVLDVVVTSSGSGYTTFPAIIADPPGTPNGNTAVLAATMTIDGTPVLGPGDASGGFQAGDTLTLKNGATVVVRNIGVGGTITSFQPITYPGSVNPIFSNTIARNSNQNTTSGSGTGAQVQFDYCVNSIAVISPGSGYNAPPNISTGGTATATAEISTVRTSYPEVCAFYQQRLFFGGGTLSPSTFYLSKPGNHYNFSVSNPIEASDSIQATLVSGELNTIKAAVPAAGGLVIFTDKATWLLNGGSYASAITPSAIVANPQSYNGSSDLPPILSNYDVLYVQSKGSIVRDSTYNIYAQIYTGQDISLMSSHLFYGHQIVEWAYAEEPFKVIWCVRDDGMLLSLTFVKEQEFIGWAHSDTVGGSFLSVASVVEPVAYGDVDATYFVVQRTVNGIPVQYIERLAERQFNTAASAWCVDCGIQYIGAPTSNFSGAQQLAGLTVTGLADGNVIPPFVMPASGAFTLGTASSTVVVGLAFTAQLQTLALDTGEPTVQGKMKKITAVTLRVLQTLGLKIGASFGTLVTMKDTVLGNVGKMSNTLVTDLVSNDIDTILDPAYTVPGQYCIQIDVPYPATILGVIPKFVLGDDK